MGDRRRRPRGAIGSLRKAQLEAEERAEEQARRQVESERLRIAREVHDVVSHSLASIAVQAGVGAHVADRRPDEAVAALHAIRATSRDALDELRGVLAVLRSDADPGAPTAPRRLHDVDHLRRVAALVGVELAVRGEVGLLPAPVEDVVCRVLQEAVTNTVRHAHGATRIAVDLRREDDELALRVHDDGGPGPAAPPGHGLRGLAERATALGGHLRAGPGADGFVVEVRLPAGSQRIPP